MTPCPGCLRHVTTDTIPAIKQAGVWTVPAFIICKFCGWCIREVEPGEST